MVSVLETGEGERKCEVSVWRLLLVGGVVWLLIDGVARSLFCFFRAVGQVGWLVVEKILWLSDRNAVSILVHFYIPDL
jgi:hypothetical protein